MDYDIGSFLAGVQVGLRLGRTPQRTFSPVPSGRYILTESGEKVIAERIVKIADLPDPEPALEETNESE